MRRTEDVEVQKARAKVRWYLIIAVALLFIMAFLSSLGDAFIYIPGGLSVLFSFLAWQNWRKASPDEFTHYNRSERGQSFVDNLRSAFRQKEKTQRASSSQRSSTSTLNTSAPTPASPVIKVIRRIVIIIISFAAGLVALVVLIVFITLNDDDETQVPEEISQDAGYLFNSGEYDAAYAAYRKGLEGNESDADDYYGMANVKSTLSEEDSALFYYDKALSVRPTMLEAAYGKALVFYNAKDYARSNQELKYIFDRSDEFVDGFLLAGDNNYMTQQYDVAIGYYERAYELGARSKELANIMAYIYDVRGDQQRAIPFYQEAFGYDSTLEDVRRRLGELLPGEEGRYYREKNETQW